MPFAARPPLRALRRQAASLVITLLCIVVLTIIVVAFMQSMSLEQKTTKSYSETYRAQLMAEAGANQAAGILANLFSNYPDSATAWVTNVAPASLGTNRQTPGTAFYYYQNVTVTNTNTATLSDILQFRMLVSGVTNAVAATNRSTALAAYSSTNDYVNINTSNFGGDRLWVGKPSGAAVAPRIDVPWVNVYDSTGTNITGRYAYWVDDESFRVNLNTATNVLRGSTSQGTNASEVPIQGALVDAISNPSDRDTLAGNIVSLRNNAVENGTLRTFNDINYANSSHANLSEEIGFETTIYSSGLNISRTGARRVNLNAVVATNTAPNDADAIYKQLGSIITTITNQVPLFGKRFYRTSTNVNNNPTVAATDQFTYVTRIAANIRDYIDSDSIPTQVLDSGGPSLSKANISLTRPQFPLGGVVGGLPKPNPYRAVGKENVPRLTESMMRVPQLIAMAGGSSVPFDIRISYYFEFWNMGTKDIKVSDLCSAPGVDDAFLRIGNQPEWHNRTSSDGQSFNLVIPPDRPYEIKLSQFFNGSSEPLVFKAGKLTVLTTDPAVTSSPLSSWWTQYWGVSLNDIFRPSINLDAFQRFSGNAQKTEVSGYQGLPTLDLITRPAAMGTPVAGATSDEATYAFIGNNIGYIESQRSAVTIAPAIFVDAYGSKNDIASFHLRGGRLTGNDGDSYAAGGVGPGGLPYQLGDPRATSDPLNFSQMGDSSPASTLFRTWRGGDAQSKLNPDQHSTLGQINIGFAPFSAILPNRWSDAGARSVSGSVAMMTYMANDQMRSIGELGFIYDPAHIVSPGTQDTASGGGRSLRIGRSEKPLGTSDPSAQWDGVDGSPSKRWAAWRLCDVFSTRDATNRGMENSIPGLINPNGALRDNGAAIQAMFAGLQFMGTNTVVDPNFANRAFTNTALITSLTNRLMQTNVNSSIFFERGEFGELDYFNTNNLAGINDPMDATREELFRRVVEMLTMKGNTFTVYAVGQSVKQLPNGQIKPLATSSRKITVRLSPLYQSQSLTFDPTNYDSTTNRLSRPTNYVISTLFQSEN